MARSIELPLVGLRHRLTPATIRALAELVPISATLKREPQNRSDRNAIAVVLTGKPFEKTKIGYVPRGTAKVIAERMDRGTFNVLSAEVSEIYAEEGRGVVVVKWSKTKP